MTNYMDKATKLDAFTWPGGYPVLWIADIDTSNCAVLCAKCAEDVRARGTAETLTPDILWEGPPEMCEDCGAEIESAYGDPDAGEDN